MNVNCDYKKILSQIGDPGNGLPQEIFDFVSSVTPMVNVDLLIRDKQSRILLARREDKFSGFVWHIPGGIVRFRETLLQRIEQVAIKEIGQRVITNGKPIEVNEVFSAHQERGHFISFLYECRLEKEFETTEKESWENGDLKWFMDCPKDFIPCQFDIYEKYFNGRQKV